ncbi:hypothetical protein PR048_000689 [Dryococelus australis]|uniref:Uncharacterized protein n=1 Tax=Dryococelus australis TaxID=614101 RepID=A0ABQ9IFX7_9NEOP|nr:hypothetical protein PR048_000689 [Dryococelus australis]
MDYRPLHAAKGFTLWQDCRLTSRIRGADLSKGVPTCCWPVMSSCCSVPLEFARCKRLNSLHILISKLPPTKAGFNPRSGSLRTFASENRAGRCRWSTGFLGDVPFPRHCIPAPAPHLSHPHRLSRSLNPIQLNCDRTLRKCSACPPGRLALVGQPVTLGEVSWSARDLHTNASSYVPCYPSGLFSRIPLPSPIFSLPNPLGSKCDKTSVDVAYCMKEEMCRSCNTSVIDNSRLAVTNTFQKVENCPGVSRNATTCSLVIFERAVNPLQEAPCHNYRCNTTSCPRPCLSQLLVSSAHLPRGQRPLPAPTLARYAHSNAFFRMLDARVMHGPRPPDAPMAIAISQYSLHVTPWPFGITELDPFICRFPCHRHISCSIATSPHLYLIGITTRLLRWFLDLSCHYSLACGEVMQCKLVLAQCCTHSTHAAGTSNPEWCREKLNVLRPLTRERRVTHYTRAVTSNALLRYHPVASSLTSPSPNQLLFHSLPELTNPSHRYQFLPQHIPLPHRPHKHGLPTPLRSPPHTV